mmetsp:Transcript_8099/g.15855  ORF Transcript_8099/g.15855 Transcript_8099/m.15855 type:complete len:114 (+) Transcript_8099:394-735(+)
MVPDQRRTCFDVLLLLVLLEGVRDPWVPRDGLIGANLFPRSAATGEAIREDSGDLQGIVESELGLLSWRMLRPSSTLRINAEKRMDRFVSSKSRRRGESVANTIVWALFIIAF